MIREFNPGDYNNEAIIRASKYGHLTVMEKLLKDSRVDPSAQNNSAIIQTIESEIPYHEVSEAQKLEVIEILLQDPRVDPSVNNNQAIIKASRAGIQILLIDYYKIRELIQVLIIMRLLEARVDTENWQ